MAWKHKNKGASRQVGRGEAMTIPRDRKVAAENSTDMADTVKALGTGLVCDRIGIRQ